MDYAATVLPGLEAVALAEIARRLPGARGRRAERGRIELSTDAEPSELLALRTVEDVFAAALRSSKITRSRRSLRMISEAVARSRTFRDATSAALSLRPRRRLTFRVVARKRGRHNWLRRDLVDAVARGVLARPGEKWRHDQESGSIELWVEVDENRLYLDVRLSDATMRHRDYKRAHVPASLRPTLAAAMVDLGSPRPGEVVLDPACGAGTLLLERATCGVPHGALLGGDIDPVALAAAEENFGPRHKPRLLAVWDARRLPVADGVVDLVLCNLPFGRKVGGEEVFATLYPPVLSECARVLAPGGRAVFLVPRRGEATGALRREPRLARVGRLDVEVLGRKASVVVMRRKWGR